jgi:NAD(P)-dependent dehydrogenase (short-subunit alcohol dehydrogenase family)
MQERGLRSEERAKSNARLCAQSSLIHPPSLIVITGASSGIGQALARHYLARGAIVAVFARRAELLDALSAEFPKQVFAYALDVRDAVAVQHAAQDFMARAGVPHIVIANAGVSVGTLTEFSEDGDAFQQVMDINVLGMVKTFQPFVAAMREAKSGTPSPQSSPIGGGGEREQHFTLVGISSVAGFRGLPGAGAYSASKAAATSYLESLRVELHGTGVKVTTICPGYIRTPMTRHNPYPMPFMLDADVAAARMARAISKQTAFTVIPWQMGLVGQVLKILPRWLYDLLFANAPHKPRRHPRSSPENV